MSSATKVRGQVGRKVRKFTSEEKTHALARAGFAARSVLYGAMGVFALLFSFQRGGGEKMVAHWLLEQPLGRWLLGAVALGVIAFGISQAWVAWREKFLKELDLPREKRLWITRLCKVGLIARGAVFAVVGWLFLRAAIEANAERADGIQGVWGWLSSQFMGEWLVPLLAVGLIAFAGYGITQAVYRKI